MIVLSEPEVPLKSQGDREFVGQNLWNKPPQESYKPDYFLV